MPEYNHLQCRNLHDQIQRSGFTDSVMRQFAAAPGLSSDDITDVLAQVRKLAQTDNPDTQRAADLVKEIRKFKPS